MSTADPGLRLLGRRSECALDELVASLRRGSSGALVLRGEAGAGKSALLAYLERRASGCGIVRAAGVESEMELAFAGLHQQLCAPCVDRPDRLADPQRDAACARSKPLIDSSSTSRSSACCPTWRRSAP